MSKPESQTAPESVYLGLPGAATRRHITFTYTNWRGETSERTVKPWGCEFAATEWHPEPQWLLQGYDVVKKEERSFAMCDMKDVRYAE